MCSFLLASLAGFIVCATCKEFWCDGVQCLVARGRGYGVGSHLLCSVGLLKIRPLFRTHFLMLRIAVVMGDVVMECAAGHDCMIKPSGHYMYHQFSIHNSTSCPTQCIYVFCMDLRTNSDLCHLQHKLIGFYNRDGVFTARYGLSKYNSGLNKNLRSAHTVYLCVLCGSENKQRLFPYTTLTDRFL